MRILSVLLLILLVMLQYRLWSGEGSVSHVQYLRQQIEHQQSVNDQLQVRNQRIRREIASLKNGLDSIEQRARSELGLVKPGETFYLFIEPE